jgi:HlyD family secretion protein
MKPSSPTPVARGGLRIQGDKRHYRRRRFPWIVGAIVVLLVVAGLWPRALPVEVAVVGRGDLLVTVNEEGMTRVKNRYVISSPVAGQLRRIDWKAGAVVEAGKTVLAVLETGAADFLDARSLAQAEARVRASAAAKAAAAAQKGRASASAKMFAADFERLKQLRAVQAISQQEFDAAEMRAATAREEERAAQFGLQVAEFELQQARALLIRGKPAAGGDDPGASEAEPLVITSPVNGRVLRVFQESARMVPSGLPLLEIGDPTDLELRIEVLSRDGVAIRPGARVIVEQWGGEAALEARVRLVEPSAFTKISALGVEEQRVYVVADFIDPVEKRPTLGDNYRIEGRVVVWEGRNVLRVPSGALFQRGAEWQCFVLAGGKARLRTVGAGRSNGLETEVVGGLREGDRVVVYPGDKISDGTRVREVAVGAAGEL